eukprot:scaffold7979_cov417-Prasinococcus_capsulatus_cf.AAC.8
MARGHRAGVSSNDTPSRRRLSLTTRSATAARTGRTSHPRRRPSPVPAGTSTRASIAMTQSSEDSCLPFSPRPASGRPLIRPLLRQQSPNLLTVRFLENGHTSGSSRCDTTETWSGAGPVYRGAVRPSEAGLRVHALIGQNS